MKLFLTVLLFAALSAPVFAQSYPVYAQPQSLTINGTLLGCSQFSCQVQDVNGYVDSVTLKGQTILLVPLQPGIQVVVAGTVQGNTLVADQISGATPPGTGMPPQYGPAYNSPAYYPPQYQQPYYPQYPQAYPQQRMTFTQIILHLRFGR